MAERATQDSRLPTATEHDKADHYKPLPQAGRNLKENIIVQNKTVHCNTQQVRLSGFAVLMARMQNKTSQYGTRQNRHSTRHNRTVQDILSSAMQGEDAQDISEHLITEQSQILDYTTKHLEHYPRALHENTKRRCKQWQKSKRSSRCRT